MFTVTHRYGHYYSSCSIIQKSALKFYSRFSLLVNKLFIPCLPIGNDLKSRILDAMKLIHKNTCIRFKRRHSSVTEDLHSSHFIVFTTIGERYALIDLFLLFCHKMVLCLTVYRLVYMHWINFQQRQWKSAQCVCSEAPSRPTIFIPSLSRVLDSLTDLEPDDGSKEIMH